MNGSIESHPDRFIIPSTAPAPTNPPTNKSNQTPKVSPTPTPFGNFHVTTATIPLRNLQEDGRTEGQRANAAAVRAFRMALALLDHVCTERGHGLPFSVVPSCSQVGALG